MALEIIVASTPIRLGRLRNPNNAKATLKFVRLKSKPGGVVVFIDIAPNEQLVSVVEQLLLEGYQVIVIDHHDLDGEPINDFERNLRQCAQRLHSKLSRANARITTRKIAPCCLSMITEGEFKEAVIVADADADGLTSALYAVGVSYDEMPRDAALLDGPIERKLEASQRGLLLLKTLLIASGEKERIEAFSLWTEAVQGDQLARVELEKLLPAWQVRADIAKRLARSAEEIVAGVLFLDAVNQPNYDPNTLATELAQEECVLFVVRQRQKRELTKILGSVAYCLETVEYERGQLSVREFLEPDYDPSGIIVHGNFRLWVSEDRWRNFLRPALLARFGR